MDLRRLCTLAAAAALMLVLPAFRKAQMRVPDALSSQTEALAVTGHNPRTWNKPLGFGPYNALSVREGSVFSWSVELFGVRGGSATKHYRLVLEGPDGAAWEVECRNRSIEAWRKGWSVELTAAFTPRLVCGLAAREGERPLRLVLGSDGRKLRGVVSAAGTDATLFEVRSSHQFEGSKLPAAEPVGYLIEHRGAAVAAVETINRGRVWLSPELEGSERGAAAAAAAALLLFDPEQSPQDGP